jgi:Rrf2 family transcriptional regulator, nitric oxide-sensitive transcriptional repressor
MRLTVYTDYTLRVMIYLSLKYQGGEVATIDEMAQAYGISRSHLTKIVNELSQSGFIETLRGRAGGARLARAPGRISLGEVVRMAEKDFAVVQCQDMALEADCAVFRACNLKRGLRRAVDAFMQELDKMTFEDAVSAPAMAASLLGMAEPVAVALPARGTRRRPAHAQPPG